MIVIKYSLWDVLFDDRNLDGWILFGYLERGGKDTKQIRDCIHNPHAASYYLKRYGILDQRLYELATVVHEL